MLNLTIQTLSLSSLYLVSPLFTGNRNVVQKFDVHNYFSTIFYNLNSLQLEKSIFNKGLGSAIYSEKSINLYIKQVYEENVNKDFSENNMQIKYDESNNLYIIRDCKFSKIEINNKRSLILIENQPTFYMTDCVFFECKINCPLLFLNSRATTFSHICCSGLSSTISDDNLPLVLSSDTPQGSFFKLIYSTISGPSEYIPTTKFVIRFLGTCAIKYQCMNLTSFTLTNTESYSIMRFYSPSCLIMKMSTFKSVDAGRIIDYNLQSPLTTSTHLISLSNFWKIKFHQECFFFDSNTGKSLEINDCRISLSEENPPSTKLIKKNGAATITVRNCIFDRSLSYEGEVNFEQNVDSNVKSHTLANYVLEGYCKGTLITDAHGCKNDKCPEDMGCPPNAFDFKTGDVIYTEKHHIDVDTPSASPSGKFTKSSYFTYSNDFTKSFMFTNSNEFSNSNGFTGTNDFSLDITKAFTDSKIFSSSFQFSSSDFFYVERDLNQGGGGKLGPGPIAGIAIGSVAAVAIIVAIIIFIIIKKKQNIDIESGADIIDGQESVITVDNALQNVMHNDDPFADEFH